jgi:cytochrome c
VDARERISSASSVQKNAAKARGADFSGQLGENAPMQITAAQLTTLAAILQCVFMPAIAADVAAGEKYFEEYCTACHTARSDDNGGSQGPSLIGVFKRRVASDPAFTYTTALQNSQLTWDAATLDRFLKAPDTLVPGTEMLIPVPAKTDRDNLVAYFQSLVSANQSTSQ